MFCESSSGLVSSMQHTRQTYIVRSIRGSVLELVSQVCLGRMKHVAVESVNHKTRDKFAERIFEGEV